MCPLQEPLNPKPPSPPCTASPGRTGSRPGAALRTHMTTAATAAPRRWHGSTYRNPTTYDVTCSQSVSQPGTWLTVATPHGLAPPCPLHMQCGSPAGRGPCGIHPWLPCAKCMFGAAITAAATRAWRHGSPPCAMWAHAQACCSKPVQGAHTCRYLPPETGPGLPSCGGGGGAAGSSGCCGGSCTTSRSWLCCAGNARAAGTRMPPRCTIRAAMLLPKGRVVQPQALVLLLVPGRTLTCRAEDINDERPTSILRRPSGG